MEAKKSPKADLESKRAYLFDTGLIISLTLMIVIFGWKTYDVNEVILKPTEKTGIIEDIIPITKQEDLKPVAPPVVAITDLNLVTNKTEVIDLGPIDFGDDATTPIPVYTIPTRPEPEPTNPEDEIIIVPDVNPVFPGGEKAMYEYLHKQVKYTELAKSTGIEGTVYVTFVVERDGSITGIRLLRGIGAGLDEQVLKSISNMPPWKPGWRAGKLVRVQYNLPFKFELKDL